MGTTVTGQFDLCYPEVVSGANMHDPSQVMSVEDTAVIQKQMNALESYKGPPRSEAHPILTARAAESPRERQFSGVPDAYISSLSLSPIPRRIRVALTARRINPDWHEVLQLIGERNLHENPEQLRAFLLIAHRVIHGGDQLLMFVNGMGGTGKSYLINAVITLFERLSRRSELLVGAPTGIAAVLIGGNTLHSLIMSGIQHTKGITQKLTDKWHQVSWLIVDEVSMVGAGFLATMSQRIRQAKGEDPLNSGRPFGGVNVIFLGDFCQLKPPLQQSLYSYALVRRPAHEQTRNNDGIDGISGAFLWRQVTTVVELRKNQRQITDPTFGNVLENIRMRRFRNPVQLMSWTNEMYIEYLRRRQINYVASHHPEQLPLFSESPVIVGPKVLRDAMNTKLVQYHAHRLGQRVHLYHSADTISKKAVPAAFRNVLWNLPTTRTSEMVGRLPIFIGMRVMITENIALHNGIVNGAEGIVTGIRYHVDEDKYRYADIVYVRIEGSGIEIDGLDRDVVPLTPVSESVLFPFSDYYAGLHAKSFRRRQLPLIPAYSYTDYKSQGRSLERCIVDLASARGQGVYVMLSRVKTLSGLLILRWFSPSQIFQPLPEELRDELRRLAQLDAATTRWWLT